jgi:peroxiredoxin
VTRFRTRSLLAAMAVAVAIPAARAADAPAAKVGAPAPDFAVQDTQGKTRRLSEFKGKPVVLEWHNQSCPFVVKHYGSGNMQALQKELTAEGAVWLTVISSAKGRQGHVTPAEADAYVKEKGAAPTAVLLDEDGTVGRLYGAKTTPHMYLVDAAGTLVYAGAIDDKPTADADDVQGAKNYVRTAYADVKAGRQVATSTTTAYGCSVKY